MVILSLKGPWDWYFWTLRYAQRLWTQKHREALIILFLVANYAWFCKSSKYYLVKVKAPTNKCSVFCLKWYVGKQLKTPEHEYASIKNTKSAVSKNFPVRRWHLRNFSKWFMLCQRNAGNFWAINRFSSFKIKRNSSIDTALQLEPSSGFRQEDWHSSRGI